GSAGIGTSTPVASLDVNGQIAQSGIVVFDALGSGGYTIRIGENAGAASVGTSDIAIGKYALENDVTGGNLAVGSRALQFSITTGFNTAVGHGALEEGPGWDNTAIGSAAGGALNVGSQNIIVGSYAGKNIDLGDDNILIGYKAEVTSAGADNQLNIGNTIFGV